MEATPSTEGELREQAITRLKKKRDFSVAREAERLQGKEGV
jgi:hypothetical protein